MIKARDIREKSIEEIEANCREARNELFHLRNEMKQTKKDAKTHLIRQKKTEIAQLLTVLKEKQLKINNKA